LYDPFESLKCSKSMPYSQDAITFGGLFNGYLGLHQWRANSQTCDDLNSGKSKPLARWVHASEGYAQLIQSRHEFAASTGLQRWSPRLEASLRLAALWGCFFSA